MHRLIAASIFLGVLVLSGCGEDDMIVERNVAIEMRDGVVLRADIYRPNTDARLPVLVYRTPYDKEYASDAYTTHLSAVKRGYAVVLQDVRGRYASDGIFEPYRNEGNDGYDTIEWAAAQDWSNGDVGTFGLSYPGAAQWLAAVQSPPQLKAMVPAMTYASPGEFFYTNGIFDLSWLPWIYFNIAPDARLRLGLEGATSDDDVAALWERDGDMLLSYLPLLDLPALRDEAPFYFEWLRHPPGDDWWSWADIRRNYGKTDAAVLNISGWYDDPYGPTGAITNYNGLVAARKGEKRRTQLILGPWQHGVMETDAEQLGELYFGPDASIDYDDTLLRFFDYHMKGIVNDLDREASVRYWVMGENAWRFADNFPPADANIETLCLLSSNGNGHLGDCTKTSEVSASAFRSDPSDPVLDPYDTYEPHDYQALAERPDVLIFDSEPLTEAVTIAGRITANMFVSCDCRDFDLWVRLLDVHPDGRAINLMSPGGDAQRVSYRDESRGKELIEPGETYRVSMDGLITANRFDVGHRIRVQVSAAFSPYVARNLQTGESEVSSSESVIATINIHHDDEHASMLELPVIP